MREGFHLRTGEIWFDSGLHLHFGQPITRDSVEMQISTPALPCGELNHSVWLSPSTLPYAE